MWAKGPAKRHGDQTAVCTDQGKKITQLTKYCPCCWNIPRKTLPRYRFSVQIQETSPLALGVVSLGTLNLGRSRMRNTNVKPSSVETNLLSPDVGNKHLPLTLGSSSPLNMPLHSLTEGRLNNAKRLSFSPQENRQTLFSDLWLCSGK